MKNDQLPIICIRCSGAKFTPKLDVKRDCKIVLKELSLCHKL